MFRASPCRLNNNYCDEDGDMVADLPADDGQFGYTLQVYTHVDSGIDELADLAGKRVAHTSPTSNSGNELVTLKGAASPPASNEAPCC